MLREGLGREGDKVPTKVIPDWLVGPLSLFVPQLRAFRHDVGVKRDADNSKAKTKLNFKPRSAMDTLIDCARSLPKHPRP